MSQSEYSGMRTPPANVDDDDGDQTSSSTTDDGLSEEDRIQEASPPDTANTTTTQLVRLIFCATGICVCYLYYGVLQEKLFTSSSGSSRRLGATFVLLTQCVTNVAVAAIWERLHDATTTKKPQHQTTMSKKASLPHALLAKTAACYVTAMVCSNEAIAYVSYPVQVLAKSCKLIPTMVVGQVMERRLYGKAEWVAALCISAGIVLFQNSRQQQSSSSVHNNTDNEEQTSGTTGMLLLIASLTMDGILSSCQNFVKQSARPPNAVETMLYINLYAVFYLIPLTVISGQWHEGIEILTATTKATESSYAGALLILNATIATGQIFIFLTIAWFTPVTTTVITTTRKFVTILLSVWLYGHSFTALQWTAVALVFTGLYIAILTTVQSGSSEVDAHKKVKQE